MTQEQAAARAQDQFARVFGGPVWVIGAWPSATGGWLVRLTDSEAEPYETWLVAVDGTDGTVVINAE